MREACGGESCAHPKATLFPFASSPRARLARLCTTRTRSGSGVGGRLDVALGGGDCGEARDGKQRRAGRPTDARLESRAALLTPGVKIERVRLDEADCQSRDRHACEQVPRAVNHVVESPRLDALLWREARAFDALLEVAR